MLLTRLRPRISALTLTRSMCVFLFKPFILRVSLFFCHSRARRERSGNVASQANSLHSLADS